MRDFFVERFWCFGLFLLHHFVGSMSSLANHIRESGDSQNAFVFSANHMLSAGS